MCNSYETYLVTKDTDEKASEIWKNPAADILESKDKFSIYINMPGVSKENVNVKVEEDELTVTGTLTVQELGDRQYIRKEIRTGNYFRKFKLTDLIDKEKIQARYQNGVLELDLMKKPEALPKSISIN
jgi:HSP20 family molecular chaperone IbpA